MQIEPDISLNPWISFSCLQIMQQSVNEKNDECLESYKKENIFLDFFLFMNRDEKEEYPLKPEESECSTEGSRDGECSVDRVWCKSKTNSMTYTIQCGITSGEALMLRIPYIIFWLLNQQYSVTIVVQINEAKNHLENKL